MLDSVALQLGVAAIVATVIFFGAYSVSQKVAAIALLILIPFQPVETRFFTANVLATYGVFLALMLRGTHIRLPMLPQILLVTFCFLLSMAFVHPATYGQHAVYMGALFSAFFVFWLSYDLALQQQDARRMVNVFLIINVLVVIYCSIQLYMGPATKLVFFDNQDFTFMPMRRDNRLTGPFGAAGAVAEYFVIMIFVVLNEIVHARSDKHRRWMISLVAANILLLITTGNRGGFLTLIGASLIFLYLFRKTLGPKRVFAFLTGGILMLTLAGAIAVNYTDFGQLFDRLAETEIEEGIPDTRQVLWPASWREVQERPLLGHGPRLRFQDGDRGRRYEGHKYVRYPHNLYLFLLLTVGFVGLTGFLIFMFTPLWRCWRASKSPIDDPYLIGLAKTGVVILIAFAVDQVKVSFMRLSMVDYWHFIFALFGFLIAVCDRIQARKRQIAIAARAPGPAHNAPEKRDTALPLSPPVRARMYDIRRADR